jgi:prepilin-type N-terminal cleavage/methylation domain-containing protein
MTRRTPGTPAGKCRGFTLVEVMIAATITLVAMSALVVVNQMAQRFLLEANYDAQMLSHATQAIDAMTREINCAYRRDAVDQTKVFSIQNSNQTFEYSVPANGGSARKRFRYDSTNQQVVQEILGAGGAWSAASTQPLIKKVDYFRVAN